MPIKQSLYTSDTSAKIVKGCVSTSRFYLMFVQDYQTRSAWIKTTYYKLSFYIVFIFLSINVTAILVESLMFHYFKKLISLNAFYKYWKMWRYSWTISSVRHEGLLLAIILNTYVFLANTQWKQRCVLAENFRMTILKRSPHLLVEGPVIWASLQSIETNPLEILNTGTLA